MYHNSGERVEKGFSVLVPTIIIICARIASTEPCLLHM